MFLGRIHHRGRSASATRLTFGIVAVLGVLTVALLPLVATGCADLGTTTMGGGGDTTGAETPGGATAVTVMAGTGSTLAGQLGTSPAEAVAATVGPSVVNVRVKGVASGQFFGSQPYEGVGSGVIFTSDGYIVTNNHVVSQNGRPAESIEVTFSTGEKVPATIVARDPFSDIAVIKVERTGLPAATFAHVSDVKIGEYAVAIGSPLDYANSVTLGIVSGLGRSIQDAGSGSAALVDLIQTDAPISPGNSGGALVDAQGRVMGINVAYLPPAQTGAESIGFAIPADTAVGVAQELIDTGRASHPYLGIGYRSVTSDLQQRYGLSRATGAIITEVGAGTPAARAGLRQGDIIVSLDDQTVEQEGDVVVALRQKKAGETVAVTVDRDGKEMTVRVILAERPATVE